MWLILINASLASHHQLLSLHEYIAQGFRGQSLRLVFCQIGLITEVKFPTYLSLVLFNSTADCFAFQVVRMDQADRMEGGEWTSDRRNDRNVQDNCCVTETPMIKMIDFLTINNYPVSGYGDASSVSSSSR